MSATLHQRLHDAAAALTGEPVALSHLADVHGSAARGTLLVLLSAPCVLPVPGVGNMLGAGLVLLALAMWRGQASHQLPSRVAGWQMPAHWAQRVLGLLARFYGLAGRWSRQRMLHLVDGPQGWIAPKVGLMGALIFLPIPFGNVLPALALSLLGLGMVFRDGLAVLLALVAGGAAVAYTAGLGALAWQWGIGPLLQRLAF